MTSNASLSGQGTGQGRPGLEAHYHGREGGFSPPPLLPPSLPSLLAPLLQGQTKPGLISGRHGQTPRQLQEPRYQQPERRPRSFLQPCRPSSCSFWACSRQCHPPAVSKPPLLPSLLQHPCSPLSRPGEPAALDAGLNRCGCVPGPGRNCLCCQPLLVPGRAVQRARECL
ncbi:PDZK1-interacting protein 1 isoform X1 [Neofelis nebulosa]|uniref:PDZK1-interacting protein 1 isoform X1 n=1 Tax=Neofelis nebulosa TaxID=61452 RepID=UPI00272C0BFB|nr:PDZK1-interacting protein 1 isoform X1 [Neofelis nebulosa]